jgi:exonuclease SbcC
MKILSIEWRNFGSYGNSTQKLDFTNGEGNFFLILGSNGAGKSTMSDVIKYSLYGRLDNKKNRDIPNRFNGNAYVKAVIEKNPTTIVTVERGLAPGFFKMFINGAEYDQAGKKNMQDYLEEEILGIPYNVFNNMISLSINDFKSFISMGTNDKRQIIDRLFGLEILGHIKWKIRNKLRDLSSEVDAINVEMRLLDHSIEKSLVELHSLNEKLKAADDAKKAVHLKDIAKHEDFIQKAIEKISEVEERDREISKIIQSHNTLITEAKIDERSTQEKINLYNQGKCPTCESDLSTDYHKSILSEYLTKNTEAKESISSINEKINELRRNRTEVNDKKVKLSSAVATSRSQVSILRKEIEKLEAPDTSEESNSLTSIIEDSQQKKKDAIKKKEEREKAVKFAKIVEEIFGDKGVKQSALKKILPMLNMEIRKVLADLNMDYRVVFNEEFAVDIQHLGFQVSPEQLSTGERKKIDFATLIALIRLMKIKFSGVNIVFLDEIFSSIDSDGIHHILKVLHKTCRELSLNIFVINHSQLPVEIFDWKLEIFKNSGFSQISLEKIG